MNYGFVIDNRRCIGCHACTVACKAEHNVPIGINRTWVKTVEKGVFPHTQRVFSVQRCNHCADPPCVEICPVTSLFIRPDGIVDFDPLRCIGCKSCMQACPYDALYIDPESGTAAKCNYCAHRIDMGLEPACVNVCPVQAIVSGDLEDPQSEIAALVSRHHVIVRKPEKNTEPNLYYIEGDHASLRPEDAAPRLDYPTTSQASGVGHFAALAAGEAPLSGRAAVSKVLSGAEGSLWESSETVRNGAPHRTYDTPIKGVLWDWEVSGYLWSKSIAAGVVVLPLLLEMSGAIALPVGLARSMVLVSLLFLAVTGALLVKDLDRPARFLYVLLRPQWRSWLVRGAYIITLFGGVSLLWLLHLIFGDAASPPSPALAVLKGVLVVLGVLTAVYTAFLFAQARGRDFWQNPLLALHMLTNSALTGGAMGLLLILLGESELQEGLVGFLRIALVLHLLILAAEVLTPHVTVDAARTMEVILRGSLRLPFWSAVLLGNVAPLVLLGLRNDGLWVLSSSVLVLTFSLVTEHVWVRAPQTVPLQ